MTLKPTQEELDACPESVVIYLKALERRDELKYLRSGGTSHNLTAKQSELGHFIAEYIKLHGFVPSYEEMSQGIGLGSKSGVSRLIAGLEERGVVVRIGGHARCIQFVNPQAWGLVE
jgi:repressor LexA